ncbi:MAG TPA: PH domain-containing protein [Jatrophihabitans sp.]|nr:PH domain-containing protein [Jatrophihabitans sp.]
MDKFVPVPGVRFVPDRRITALAAAGALVALLLCLFSAGDAPGRLLFGIAAAVLAVYVASDLVFSPRLTVSEDGLSIRSPFATARVPWAEVAAVRAETRTRFGLRSTTLEIDAGTVLAVLSRRALGADPERVAQVVSGYRPR